MDRLRLAVIDTGVDPAHPAIPPVAAGVRLSIGPDGAVVASDDWRDTAGHGTACAGVAARDIAARLSLYAVRVVDDQGTSTVRLVEAALSWALSQGARVINVSLGAPSFQAEARARLAVLCADAARRGVVIVAAAGPEGTRALPAVLDEVISVGSAAGPTDTLHLAADPHVDFLAKGDLQRIAWLEGRSVLGQGASLAAAHVTNAVCRLLLRRPELDVEGVRAALAARALPGDVAAGSERFRQVEGFYQGRRPARASFLRRAAVYPFNKETHALVRYRAQLPFTLAAVADPPGKRLVGRDAGEVLGELPAGLAIQPSFERALDLADGVVLGHLEALPSNASRALLRDLVARAVAHGKGVYSFSRLDGPDLEDVRAEAARRGIPLVDPTVGRADVTPLLQACRAGAAGAVLGRPLLHECPVLGVFGTSRAQGKFSLQLGLRATLSEMGYRVSHLATEPSGMLFGATATLPTGYERGNDLSSDETVQLTRVLVTEIKNRERPDLLMVGGQSSTVPLRPEVHGAHGAAGALATLSFGAATQPDACVLVCNLFDPPAHVERCRAALSAVLGARVLAAAFGDQVWEEREWKGVRRRRLVRLSREAFTAQLAAWEQRLGLPCCGVLAPGAMERLAEIVVDYFATAADESAAPPPCPVASCSPPSGGVSGVW